MTDIKVDKIDFNLSLKDYNDLSIGARNTLNLIDTYLSIMLENLGEIRMSELNLYHTRWDELQTSLVFVTRGSDHPASLVDNTYRGVKIVRMEWEL